MKIIAENRKARFNYEIIDSLEAGIVLTGAEVKSSKAGHMSLKNSYATIREEEIYLTNTHIAPYKFAKNKDYDPTRSRKLLLNKKEIKSLIGKLQTKGLTLVPLRAYIKRGMIKIDLGLGKGKKLIDKRETIKKRDLEREIRRELKNK